ncbi:DUF1446 domain-containing protein [soil metagenome]
MSNEEQRIVNIGGASGAWGDSPMAIGQLLKADIQYLMMDYLAEVTMSLLAKARLKDPNAGYPPDFVGYLKPHLKELKARGIRVASNAGGVNPQSCKAALEAIGAELGIDLRVAVVLGDDLMPQVDSLREEGVREWVSGAPLPARLLTANAYLGALPIAEAFARGADIVITGRCADSALALGILMHEFGWRADDYDAMAAGSLVGHLLECGPQSTGGVFTDWERVPGWHDIGYPIAQCSADGSFVLTKPEGTGGLVVPETAAEQVLYEVGDPEAYVLPDVVADFSNVRLEQVGEHRVRISGAKGRAPTAQFKVSATYQDGYRAVAMAAIVGFDAVRKGERTAQALVQRARDLIAARGMADFSAVHIEVLGGEASYGAKSMARMAREVVVRVVVEHADAKALDVFARELGSVGLSFAQGTTGLIGGRPKPAAVVKLYTFFIDKSRMKQTIQVGSDAPLVVEIPPGVDAAQDSSPRTTPASVQATATASSADLIEVPLLRVAHARSGDKGDSSNIAIYCRKPSYVDYLREQLTCERIAAHFEGSVQGTVQRFEAPGLSAFNFLIDQALGGGGMASRRIDPQGKAYGQRALEMLVSVPAAWLDEQPVR